jgi:hypothetical protein
MQTLNALFLSVAVVLQPCIVFQLFRRKLQKRFFWFLIYSSYVWFEAVSRLIAVGNEHAYFAAYWLTSLGGLTFTAFALWESFRGILWLETNQTWFRWVFWSCISVILIYGGLRAWLYPPRGMTFLLATLVQLEIGQDYLVIAFGVLYFGLVRFFKVIGHQRESTIIWGFGVSSTLSALGVLIRSVFVTKFFLLSASLPAIGYIVAELAWTRDLLREEQRVPEPEVSLEELGGALKYYTDLLYRYLGKEVRE